MHEFVKKVTGVILIAVILFACYWLFFRTDPPNGDYHNVNGTMGNIETGIGSAEDHLGDAANEIGTVEKELDGAGKDIDDLSRQSDQLAGKVDESQQIIDESECLIGEGISGTERIEGIIEDIERGNRGTESGREDGQKTT